MCEVASSDSSLMLKMRASSCDLEPNNARVDISAEQRTAIADLLDLDEPALNERLSLHARLLLSELLVTLRADSSFAPVLRLDAEAAQRCALHVYVDNVGVNFGCKPDAYSGDVYWQTVRCELIQRGKTSVPLISRVLQAVEPASAAVPTESVPLEVDSACAFQEAGYLDRLPALVQRSDQAHKTSRWQLGLRREWEHTAEDTAMIPGEVASSSIRVCWRCSEQLAVLLGHFGTHLALHFLERLAVPDSGLAPNGPHNHGLTPDAALSKKRKRKKRSRAALARLLAQIHGLSISIEIDLTAPVWLLAVDPTAMCDRCLELRANRLVVKASLSRREPEHEANDTDGERLPEGARDHLETTRSVAPVSVTVNVQLLGLRVQPVSMDALYSGKARAPSDDRLFGPFDASLEGSAETLRHGALDLCLSFTPFAVALTPALVETVSLAFGNLKPPDYTPPPMLSPSRGSTSSAAISWSGNREAASALPDEALAVLQRLRCRVVLPLVEVLVATSPSSGSESCAPLILRLVGLTLAVHGSETPKVAFGDSVAESVGLRGGAELTGQLALCFAVEALTLHPAPKLQLHSGGALTQSVSSEAPPHFPGLATCLDASPLPLIELLPIESETSEGVAMRLNVTLSVAKGVTFVEPPAMKLGLVGIHIPLRATSGLFLSSSRAWAQCLDAQPRRKVRTLVPKLFLDLAAHQPLSASCPGCVSAEVSEQEQPRKRPRLQSLP